MSLTLKKVSTKSPGLAATYSAQVSNLVDALQEAPHCSGWAATPQKSRLSTIFMSLNALSTLHCLIA